MPKDLPSPELLRKLLRYEPHTGKLFWLPRLVAEFPDARTGKTWNTRFSGKEALNTNNSKGYLVGSVLGKMLLSHRVAWAIANGEWPKNEIDHINGNRKDNKISNLRDVPSYLNSRNCKGSPKNTSGHNGVHFSKSRKKWVARIKLHGITYHIGIFTDIEDAIAARLNAENGLGFTKRHGTPMRPISFEKAVS